MIGGPTRTATGQGSNSVLVRNFNERVILATLRRLGQASKTEIARQAGLTNNATGVIVRELELAGLIREDGKKRNGTRGQPATMLSLVPEGAYGFGVRVDCTIIEVVLVDFTGTVVGQVRHTMLLPRPQEGVRLLAAGIAELREQLPPCAIGRISGVGIAAPNTFSGWLTQLDLPPEHFAEWEGFPLAEALHEQVDIAVFSENDGNAATVAELFYGRGREVSDFLYLFIGQALSGGIVLNGEYRRGATGNAGSLATLPVPRSKLASAPPVDGETDILLSRASVNALLRHLRFHGASIRCPAEIAAVARKLPDAMQEWLSDCVDALIQPILSAALVLDVPHVVIDGDLDRPLLMEIIRLLQTRLNAESPSVVPPPRLLLGSFGSDAGAIGAASLPMHLNFSPLATVLTGSRSHPSESLAYAGHPSHVAS